MTAIVTITGWLRRMIWRVRTRARVFILNTCYGMHIHKSALIAVGAKMDKTYGAGLHIGEETAIASGAIIYTHDYCRGLRANTHVGRRCFVGANSIIMAGVTIGDECVIGSGSIVTKDIPSNCMVAGNPAKIIREEIHTKRYGQLIT